MRRSRTVSKKQKGVTLFGICIVCIVFIVCTVCFRHEEHIVQPASPTSPDSPVRHSLQIADLQSFKFSQRTKSSRLLLKTISNWNCHHPHGSFRGDGERRRLLCSSNIEPCDSTAHFQYILNFGRKNLTLPGSTF